MKINKYNSPCKSLYINNAPATTMAAANPAAVNLFNSAAPLPGFPEGLGASDGESEMDEGVISEGELDGEPEGDGEGDGGELIPAEGEGDGPPPMGEGGDDSGEFAEGETDGTGEVFLGEGATGVLVGEDAGD